MKLGLLLVLREGRVLEDNAGKNIWTSEGEVGSTEKGMRMPLEDYCIDE
jgi:hypothetical protein